MLAGKKSQAQVITYSFTLQRSDFLRRELEGLAEHTAGQVGLGANEAKSLGTRQIDKTEKALTVVDPSGAAAWPVEDKEQ